MHARMCIATVQRVHFLQFLLWTRVAGRLRWDVGHLTVGSPETCLPNQRRRDRAQSCRHRTAWGLWPRPSLTHLAWARVFDI